MRRSLIATGVAAAAFLAAPAHAIQAPTENPPLQIDPWLDRDVFAETEHYCMTLALFFEGGSTGESEEGLRHIARVIGERRKANRRIWGGSTICGVVFYQAKGVCQFSFACLPLARRTPRKGRLWDLSAVIARDELDGRNEELPSLLRYYMNAELTPARNECRFRKEFVPVIKAGRHEFFREPTSWERKEVAQGEYDACKRYEAALKAAKEKAKKKLAKKKKGKQQLAKARGKPKVARSKEARLKR
jgi:spore germination cell wall hydrolase CwlJ-like protein